MVIRATFKDGAAVPETDIQIPDGTAVGIIVPETAGDGDEIPPELKDEFKLWLNVSADAWEKSLEWERETA